MNTTYNLYGGSLPTVEGFADLDSSTTAYPWVVWNKQAPAATELKWFKPGYRASFS